MLKKDAVVHKLNNKTIEIHFTKNKIYIFILKNVSEFRANYRIGIS